MKLAGLVICGMLLGAGSAYACTDPVSKKAVRSADESVIVYEYFRPVKLQEKKKNVRPLTQIADSILTTARQQFEASAATTTTHSARISYETKATPKEYLERAEIELYRIKSWADSICNAFRRGTYKLGPEDVPR
jgi:hypothetical protein